MTKKYIAFSMDDSFFPEDCLIQKTRRNLSDVRIDECKVVLPYGKDHLLDEAEIVSSAILRIKDSIFLFSKSDGDMSTFVRQHILLPLKWKHKTKRIYLAGICGNIFKIDFLLERLGFRSTTQRKALGSILDKALDEPLSNEATRKRIGT